MLVPIEWLNDYIDIDVSDEEFCDRMIMSGSNLETCEHFCEEMERVVVGKIEKIEKHPDAISWWCVRSIQAKKNRSRS